MYGLLTWVEGEGELWAPGRSDLRDASKMNCYAVVFIEYSPHVNRFEHFASRGR
jgi:hypothetical protein